MVVYEVIYIIVCVARPVGRGRCIICVLFVFWVGVGFKVVVEFGVVFEFVSDVVVEDWSSMMLAGHGFFVFRFVFFVFCVWIRYRICVVFWAGFIS